MAATRTQAGFAGRNHPTLALATPFEVSPVLAWSRFFAYVIAQALNPAWRRTSTPQVTYPVKQDPLAWLPSGVDAPFERMNAWRMLCIWNGAWTLACARSPSPPRTTCVD